MQIVRKYLILLVNIENSSCMNVVKSAHSDSSNGKGDYKMTKSEKVEATRRALLALATEMADLNEAHRRVAIQVAALAAEHDVQMPESNLN